ncbi:hypothetical protein F5Y00DRAFT_223185 [Daldinia vernicosa]|uniref:uncharacterized protein n=1 Tax=Daldinia vernicosa TaxID=114800 RepID=UPI0020082677|nr:uncharacterized protein F5Y00DRAFT_223185 [Daldinia vernicosa]KAI0854463.1 hypothetical protein F5Y00DRAFT_223185 [Daldinia vernicosa]
MVASLPPDLLLLVPAMIFYIDTGLVCGSLHVSGLHTTSRISYGLPSQIKRLPTLDRFDRQKPTPTRPRLV